MSAGKQQQSLDSGNPADHECLWEKLLHSLEELRTCCGRIIDICPHIGYAVGELGSSKEDRIEEQLGKVLGLGCRCSHVTHEERTVGDKVCMVLPIPMQVEQVKGQLRVDAVKVKLGRDNIHDLVLALPSGHSSEAVGECGTVKVDRRRRRRPELVRRCRNICRPKGCTRGAMVVGLAPVVYAEM